MNSDLAKGEPNDVDRRVGAAITARREAAGLTGEDLADALAVTPQQIGRYESGEARVSASRLFLISERLGVPIACFFSGLSGETFSSPATTEELIRLISTLSPPRQQMVIDIVRTVARAQMAD